jgi:hypothetical protein
MARMRRDPDAFSRRQMLATLGGAIRAPTDERSTDAR